MKLRYVLIAALWGLISTAAFAATPAPASSTAGKPHPGMNYCAEHTQECKDNAAKFDTWCSANAEKCTALKNWAEKRREYCEANGKKCEEHMHKMHEHMKEWCSKNPDDEHCKMMKDRKSGDMGDMGGDMPPPPSM